MSPEILGIWRIGQLIHDSSTARVHVAQPADSGDSPRWDYVVKFADLQEHGLEGQRQIQQAAMASTSTSHPNLVPVLDWSASGNFPYLVMPRITGGTLKETLESPESVAIPVVLWLVRQAAQALGSLHAKGWVHGDLSPSCVIVGERGHVTLIDLSRATQINTAPVSKFRGSANFAAPETAQVGFAAQASADVFALGRILWTALALAKENDAFVLEPVAELIEKMVDVQPPMRPTAESVTDRLLQLELKLLGSHFHPGASKRAA